MKKKILLLGSSSFIGKNFLDNVNLSKWSVIATYNTKKPTFRSKIKFIKVNTTKVNDFKKIPKDIHIVIHLANKVITAKMFKKSKKTDVQIFLLSMINILNFCKLNSVKKLIYISSSTGYSDNLKNFKEENYFRFSPSKNNFIIGMISRFLEKIIFLHSKFNKYKTKIIILRPTAIYGKYDNFNINDARMLPFLISIFNKSKNKIVLPGTGKLIRNWIYAEDFVNLIIKLCSYSFKNKKTILNVASKTYISTFNLAKKIQKYFEKNNVEILTEKNTYEKLKVKKLNIDKLKNIGIKFETNSIDYNLKKTIKWYCNQNK